MCKVIGTAAHAGCAPHVVGVLTRQMVLGLDSVMAVGKRQALQDALKSRLIDREICG